MEQELTFEFVCFVLSLCLAFIVSEGEAAMTADLELVLRMRSDLQTEAFSILRRMARGRRHPRGSSGLLADMARISEIVELSGLEPQPRNNQTSNKSIKQVNQP